MNIFSLSVNLILCIYQSLSLVLKILLFTRTLLMLRRLFFELNLLCYRLDLLRFIEFYVLTLVYLTLNLEKSHLLHLQIDVLNLTFLVGVKISDRFFCLTVVYVSTHGTTEYIFVVIDWVWTFTSLAWY